MIWVFLWMFIRVLIDDFKWRVTDPIAWAHDRVEQVDKGFLYFLGVIGVLVLLMNLTSYTPGDFGDVFWLMLWAVLGPTDVLAAYVAYKADHENDDEDQDGNNFAWVH